MRSFFLFSLAAACVAAFAQPQTNILVDPNLIHIGQKTVSSFPEPVRKPSAPRLDRSFESQANAEEWTLQIKQQHAVDEWEIELNGHPLDRLNITDSERVTHFAIPPRAILEGTNTLSIVPHGKTNDILLSHIEIIPQRMRDLLKLAHVVVNVTDLSGRFPVPARVTIVNAENKLAQLYNVRPSTAAWRKGIFYTGAKTVEFDLPQGDWTVSATRGLEWSRTQIKLRVFIGQNATVNIPIAQQLDTPGYIAADTHVHTYTFSGHGDASVDDRIWTLAGEGLELAIATDHNHFTDYKPRQDALGASAYYTSVIGNEITTDNGHFNGFPFKVDSQKPNHKETNWVKLVADIRSKGAQYVILNHPRWPAITNSPFSIWGLNRADGSHTNTSVQFTMDAIELQNSSYPVPPKDPNFVLRDWFALLNRGEHLWAVGASDSHTISEPPGQGRTYIASSAAEPASIDINDAIKSMRAGNMSVSYGIFGTATVNGRVPMGGIAKPNDDGTIDVKFHVACPDWIKAGRAVVYLNGIQVAEQQLTMAAHTALKTNLTFKITAPSHDAYIVCVAYGDGIKDPSWKTMADFTLAVTNPIFIDADRDGKYASPHETALALQEKIQPVTISSVEKSIESLEPSTAIQLLSEAKLRINANDVTACESLIEKLVSTNAPSKK
ncbi:MAG TPA: CehA/McbA family metallohydrolase [Verrucomicrobiae bacterium]